MSARTLLVVSASADSEAQEQVALGRWPRKDFLELTRALDADVIDHSSMEANRGLRAAARLIGRPAAQAIAAFRRRSRYDSIFSDGEHIGIPLAMLLRLDRRRPRHVMLGHLLSTRLKGIVFRFLRPGSGFDVMLVHASSQRAICVDRLGLPADGIDLIPYQADPVFWSPRPPEAGEAVVCSAGLEYRDYGTLIAAVQDMPLKLVVAAASQWSRHRDTTADAPLPANVEFVALDYAGLRSLYARARFVVVPLREVRNQAGITTILEAMAMAKPVIVTATSGQRDVIRGRLCTAHAVGAALIGGPAAFGLTGPLAEAETGLYVVPGDPAALRTAIRYLLEHPDEAARMGAAGRRLIEQAMNVEEFVRRVGHQILGDLQTGRGSVFDSALPPDNTSPAEMSAAVST